ncbi:MAG: Amidohydrolase [bacterium ADurb.Bin429]|nr:MAG: Amidohydrolase [bacterium ADurb.Bin429]
MIIDIHTHTFPDALTERAIAQLSARAGVPAYTDGTCDGLRASMARAGVGVSCVMPVATKPAQVRAINAWAAEVNARCADLICFGVLYPGAEGWEAEIAQLVADGIRGVKLHPDYQDFFVDEPRAIELFRAIADAGLILLVHAGVDIGLPPPTHCPPDRLARALDAAPNLTVIAAHMGGFRQWEDVHYYLAGRDLYLDTCYTLPELGPEPMTALIRAHGPERVLFGTDSPWADQAADIAALRALPLTETEHTAILSENARRLLGL